jgi:hypothetical protein
VQFKEFKRKMDIVYYDKKITYYNNDIENQGTVDNVIHINAVQSDAVYMYVRNPVKNELTTWGRASKVEVQ